MTDHKESHVRESTSKESTKPMKQPLEVNTLFNTHTSMAQASVIYVLAVTVIQMKRYGRNEVEAIRQPTQNLVALIASAPCITLCPEWPRGPPGQRRLDPGPRVLVEDAD